MGPVDGAKAGDVLVELLEIDESERVNALDRLCCGDRALAGEVQELLICATAADSYFARLEPEEENRPTLVGRRVGVYRVVEELGRGGMGAVYRALRDDGAFSREVAIKFVSFLAAGSDSWRRFEQEKRLL